MKMLTAQISDGAPRSRMSRYLPEGDARMPSIGAASGPTSLNGSEARLRTSVMSSVLRKPCWVFSLEKDTTRAEGPSHRTPLTTSLCAPAIPASPSDNTAPIRLRILVCNQMEADSELSTR